MCNHLKKNVFVECLILVLLLSFMLSFITVAGSPEVGTIVVSNDYSTIQEAIDNASEGDTVFVKSGTYYNQTIVITKSISLVGEDPKTTIIKGKTGVLFPYTSIVIYLKANDVKISGFTVISPTAQVFCIYGSGNRTIVENNLLNSGRSAIELTGNNNNVKNNNLTRYTILCFGSNNTISGNRINSAGGIQVEGAFNSIYSNHLAFSAIMVTGDNNIINNNFITEGNTGISLKFCSGNSVFENSITGMWFRGILLHESSNNLLYDNYIVNNIGNEGQRNGYGILVTGSLQGVENNTIYRNTFLNNSYTIGLEKSYVNNHWDNGVQGNYWDDYNGTDTDEDGIGDTPHILDANNQDNFPVMDYSSIPEFPCWFILPMCIALMLTVVTIKNRLLSKIT